MRLKTKRRKQRIKARQMRKEVVLPTPERMAKGDVVRLASGQVKCRNATFLDMIIEKDVFFDELDAEDLYFALAFMMDLTERSGLFASATGNISEFSFITGQADPDMSAADEWRYIMRSLSYDARKIIENLLTGTGFYSASEIYSHIRHIRELARIVENFRFSKINLTKY